MIDDLRRALAFLTILPVGYPEGGRPGRMFAYAPLVGLGIGAGVAAAASISFVTRDVAAFLALLVWATLTGGLHLDGFGDTCDGLLATVKPSRRLEIMKDSRAGSWAVVGLALLLLGKWVALRDLPAVALLLPPVAGRWAMTLAAWGFPYARQSGIGGYFREGLGRAQVLAASLTAAAVCALAAALLDARALLPLAVAPAAVIVVGRWAARRLGGGLTGDVYGALCELTELICLIAMNGIG